MMDTSLKGPIVEKKGRKNASEPYEKPFDDDKITDCERYENPKNSSCEGFINLKQRRKQLKPIKIATNLEDMVKVPKQIIGLNNDLDNINDMSQIVPKETSSKTEEDDEDDDDDDDDDCGGEDEDEGRSPSSELTVNDVHFPKDENRLQTDGKSDDNCIREIDKLDDVTELNVPKLEAGPNILADPSFLFPFRFHPFKTHPFWLPGDPKIFNYEAYCLLCKKEFCNKYFLKTHKANKHGIVDDGTSTVAMKQIAEYLKVMTKQTENGVAPSETECKQPFCDLCNRKYSGKYLSKRRRTKSHQHKRLDDDGYYGEGNTTVQSSSQISTNETGSTLSSYEPLALIQNDKIDVDIDNHENEKPIIEQETPLNLIVTGKESVDGDEEEEENSMNAKSEESEKEADMEIENDEGPTETGYESDGVERDTANESDDGSSENIEKLQTMLLKLTPSEIETKICNVCNEIMDGNHDQKCVPKPEREVFPESMNESSNESKTDMPMLKKENRYMFMNRLESVKKIKPTSSYCEICNKELCNKYFMRTHMQRMHGIEIEHGTQLGGVTCNVCNKELCSKYFLRVHKQNTHGIMNPNSMVGPSTSGSASNHRLEMKSVRGDHRFPPTFTQVCYLCNKRFRSPKWLQAHFLNEHRDEVAKTKEAIATSTVTTTTTDEEIKEEPETATIRIPKKSPNLPTEPTETPETLNVISKLFWENNSLSKCYTCSQCPFSTSVLAFLFVHERSHVVQTTQEQSEMVKPSVSLQNLIHDKTFWQHKITQQITDCLDLSDASKAKQPVSLEQNGS